MAWTVRALHSHRLVDLMIILHTKVTHSCHSPLTKDRVSTLLCDKFTLNISSVGLIHSYFIHKLIESCSSYIRLYFRLIYLFSLSFKQCLFSEVWLTDYIKLVIRCRRYIIYMDTVTPRFWMQLCGLHYWQIGFG